MSSALHFGHGPFFPANFSLTENRVRHLGQVTAIGMGEDEQETGAMENRSEDAAAAGDSLLARHPLVQPYSEPLAHVVLYQPQIPQNTGNIGRTCVATGSMLWIVQPAAFQIDEKRVRRAGLDYWQHLRWADVASWQQLRERLPEKRYWYFSRFATQTIWQADFKAGDVIVFGSETTGLPRSILRPDAADAVRLPTDVRVRSLNLSSTVAVVLYEMLRRRDQAR
jgi:tRNA (cytidine/uridine-2'-O-)-methyltransferase